jgi:hypothetical protein
MPQIIKLLTESEIVLDKNIVNWCNLLTPQVLVITIGISSALVLNSTLLYNVYVADIQIQFNTLLAKFSEDTCFHTRDRNLIRTSQI